MNLMTPANLTELTSMHIHLRLQGAQYDVSHDTSLFDMVDLIFHLPFILGFKDVNKMNLMIPAYLT
jgi:hypothetical protein